MNKRKNAEQYQENRYTDGKHYSKKRQTRGKSSYLSMMGFRDLQKCFS